MIDDTASGAYALGALSAAELETFEERLHSSEDLRSEVAGFTDTAAMLGEAVPAVTPPAALRDNLLALIETTPQNASPVEQPQLQAPDAVTSHSRASHRAGDAPVASLDEARHRRRGGPRRFAAGLVAAAAAIALFAGGIAVGNGLGEDTDAEQFAAISAAADLDRVDTVLPAGGTVSLMASADLALTAVVFHDMEPLPANEIYQAWYVRDGVPVSAGILPVEAGDRYLVLDEGYRSSDTVALTVEPAGGSEQPTTDPIVFADERSA